MAGDSIEAITALLVETEQAHGRFEETELKGVYDQAWPKWYAAYAVEHGLSALVGHDVTADRLEQLLASGYAEFEKIEPKPSESWATYAARRIAVDL